jgi:hypothetical protein
MSQHQHQQQMIGPSSTNASQDVSRLYKQYRTSQEYSAAEMHPPSISSHAAAAAAAAADPAAQLTADAVRVHQEQHLLRQQRQLLLKAQQAEAAAAAAQAAQLQQLQVQHQQQQAALAARAAAAAAAAASFGGSQASSQAAQPMPLYGQFRPAKAAQQHWDSSTAAAVHPSQPSRHIAAPLAASAGLPPRPTVNASHHHQHHHQQQQQSLFAAGSSSSSGASSRGTVVFPRSGAAAAVAPAPAAAAAAPAGSARPLGAWSGAYAVMNNVVLPASQESEHTSGCFALECEEDLFSPGTGEGYFYQPKAGAAVLQQQQMLLHEQHLQQQQYGGSRYAAVDLPQAEVDEQLASLIEESGSSKPDDEDCPSCDMEEDLADQADAGPAGGPFDQVNRGSGFKANQLHDVDATALVAAQAAALATQQAAEQRHGVVLQVLGRVASLRKGQPVLTSSPRAAVAAGAASVRSRLLITEVSLYTNKAANSQMALDQSNVLMGKMAIPGAWGFLFFGLWLLLHTHSVCGQGVDIWARAVNCILFGRCPASSRCLQNIDIMMDSKSCWHWMHTHCSYQLYNSSCHKQLTTQAPSSFLQVRIFCCCLFKEVVVVVFCFPAVQTTSSTCLYPPPPSSSRQALPGSFPPLSSAWAAATCSACWPACLSWQKLCWPAPGLRNMLPTCLSW